MARAEPERPFPPGDYPLIVIGSGPGALQVSYCLGRLGVEHAVLSADEAPGGMFRRWPFFQRLLSWTKPYAPVTRDSRAYERYDWNSLLADEPEHRSLQAQFMDHTSSFPSRPEMERSLVSFAQATGIRIRHGCRWTATQREETAAGARFVLETTDGEYRTPLVVAAVGVCQPFTPAFPGSDLTAHYAKTRPAESYAGRRVLIIGKQNSGFELASGLLNWASRIVLASPSSTRLSVNTRSLVGVRARYVQPYEDHVLGGGVSVLDAAIQSVTRDDGGSLTVHLRPTNGGEELAIAADEVIAATGFTCPLGDLPSLGVATFGQSLLPTQTPFWESTTVPGLYFAGTIGQGSPGLKKHGLPSNSGAVHGARYNARVLARRIAAVHFSKAPMDRVVDPSALVDFALGEIDGCPELWHQKAYLARVVTVEPDGLHDRGIAPLAHVLDEGGPDAIVLTLEADGSGSIYPVVYLRRRGAISEHALDADPLLDYTSDRYRRPLASILEAIVPGAVVR
ncbi:MAG TPA: NAD(P)-binding domain-containing protein [Candidatus Limnocylindrales bacterium]